MIWTDGRTDRQTDRRTDIIFFIPIQAEGGCAARVAGQTDTLCCVFVAERERRAPCRVLLDPSQADENLVCSLLGAEGEKIFCGGRKNYFLARAHFLLLFASVIRCRRTFDMDGQTDRQTDIIFFIPI